LRGLDGLKIVSADLVEVAPAYDTNAELVRYNLDLDSFDSHLILSYL
jgi:arginase family enzyme